MPPRQRKPVRKTVARLEKRKLVYRDSSGRFVKKPVRSSQVKPIISFETPRHVVTPEQHGAKRLKRLRQLASRSGRQPDLKAVNPDSQNQYEKFLSALAADALTKLRKGRRSRQLEKALGKFKYSKKDVGNIVFVTVDGKRMDYKPHADIQGKSGYFVRVDGVGQLTVLNTVDRDTVSRGDKATGTPMPVNRRFADLSQLQKKAPGEFEAILPPRDTIYSSPVKSQIITGGELTKWLTKAANNVMERFVAVQFGHSQWILRGVVMVKDVEQLVSFTSGLLRSQYYLQFDDTLGAVRQFVMREGRQWRQHVIDLIYAGLATALAQQGLVSVGSMRRVKRLPFNSRKKRMEWLNKRGDNWDGRKMVDVVIEEIEWKLEKLI